MFWEFLKLWFRNIVKGKRLFWSFDFLKKIRELVYIV